MRFGRALPFGFVALLGFSLTGCDSETVGSAAKSLAPESGRRIYQGPTPTTPARRLTPKGGSSEAGFQMDGEFRVGLLPNLSYRHRLADQPEYQRFALLAHAPRCVILRGCHPELDSGSHRWRKRC